MPKTSKNDKIRNLPTDDENKWEQFKEYNKRDVVVEMDIQRRLRKFPVSEREWENYELDQIINDRGIILDMDFVRQAICCDKNNKGVLLKRAKDLTKIENPNSSEQLKNWLNMQGVKINSLAKSSVDKLLKEDTPKAEVVEEVLKLRKELSKSSVKKYVTMENVVNKDNGARGLIQFYGGSKTGRFAGRLIQVQNLPQNHMKDLEVARSMVKSGDFEGLELLYDSRSDVLSQLIRTAFVPRKGYKFVVADFSSIEARVLSYITNEKWRIDAFEKNYDIYCASASKMFKVEVLKNGVNGHLRQQGKIAELALGYGGSVGALKSMGALEMGMEEDELRQLVYVWRNANKNIVDFWWEIDKGVKSVILTKNPVKVCGISIFYEDNILFISLLNKRKLCYRNPQIVGNKFGGTSIIYEGISNNKYSKIESYGPKFVENIVQAIARDLLCEAMRNLSERGFHIVMHVHDEVVVEVKEESDLMEEILNIMSISPPWAKGLNLRAEAFETYFYKKN